MILLTGATGFLGSAILAQLLKRGDEVVAIKRSSSSVDKIRAWLEHPMLHLVDIDKNDPTHLFDRYKIDTIVHTATEYGRSGVPLYNILNANLVLPLQLAEIGMHRGARTFINTDSFFNKGGNSYSNLLNYSLSKKSLLIWLDKLAGQISIINVVLEHMYGPGDSSSKFVEHVIRKIGIERVPYLALTHGHQKRDFVYIDDVVKAYLTLIDYGRLEELSFETFELGTGHSTQVRDFVDQIKWKARSDTVLGYGDIEYRPDEIMSSSADVSRLERLGWSYSVSFEAGIERILDQYGSKST